MAPVCPFAYPDGAVTGSPECFVSYVTQRALRMVGFIVSDRRAGQSCFRERGGDRSCIGTVLGEIKYFALAKVDRQLPYD